MAAADAKPVPVKNTAYRVTFGIFKNDGTLITAAAGLDPEVSKDAGTFTNATNAVTEVATSSGVYYLDLTASEMNADTVAILVKSSTTGAVPVVIVLYPQETGDIRVSTDAGIRKNRAIANFPFLMTDSTNHNPATGLTVSATRSIDGAAFGAGTIANMTEVGNGVYQCDLGAGDLNGDTIALRFTASGADDLVITLVTEP